MKCLGIVAASLGVGAHAMPAQVALPIDVPDSLTGRTVITYVTTQTVYLGAGSQDGLTARSRVIVVKGGLGVAELQVSYVSWHSASADFASDSGLLSIGDTVRFSMAPVDSVVIAPVGLVGPTATPTLRDLGIRGRIGVSYQMVAPLGDVPGSMSQPALEVRADGARVSGTPFSFVIDARARRTLTSTVDALGTTDAGTRVYQAFVDWADARSGFQATVGRQFSSALSPVSLFDGATVQVDGRRWGGGLFAGTQPDPVTMDFSSLIREGGGYVQLHQENVAPAAPPPAGASATAPPLARRWSVTLGAVDSYAGSMINREFLFAQFIYADPRVYLFATEEVDYNPAWKTALGEPTIQPTSTFATAQFTLSPSTFLHAGFDDRRAVRLYRDTVTVEEEFDDQFRQGFWAGVSLSPSTVLRLGFDGRLSSGGPTGNAVVTTANAVLTPRGLALESQFRLRGSYYTSTTSSGWLLAGAYGFAPVLGLRFEASAGAQLDRPTAGVAAAFDAPQQLSHWVGLDADVALGNSWYFVLSATNTNGGAQSSNALYSSLSYRF